MIKRKVAERKKYIKVTLANKINALIQNNSRKY